MESKFGRMVSIARVDELRWFSVNFDISILNNLAYDDIRWCRTIIGRKYEAVYSNEEYKDYERDMYMGPGPIRYSLRSFFGIFYLGSFRKVYHEMEKGGCWFCRK